MDKLQRDPSVSISTVGVSIPSQSHCLLQLGKRGERERGEEGELSKWWVDPRNLTISLTCPPMWPLDTFLSAIQDAKQVGGLRNFKHMF